MRKKKGMMAYLLVGILVLAQLTGCAFQVSSIAEQSSGSMDGSENSQSTAQNTTTSGEIVTSETQIDTEFTARDMEVGYEESTAVQITLNKDSVSITGSGATFADGVLTINKEGTYVLTGELNNSQIVVNAAEQDKVQIVLNGVSIHCEGKAPIYVKQADKVFLTLQEGTENTLTDSTEQYAVDGDTNIDGVIFSKADITINGAGSLNITANYKHGIVSKDDLVITGGTISITANGQGLNGKDCVKIKDGTFVLETQGDGIQSDHTEDETKGFVYIAGGNFTINAQTDGIQAETVLRVDDGSFMITTGGGSANASTDQAGNARPEWGKWGETANTTDQKTEETTASAKGFKAGKELIINMGAITVDSSDDSIHCNGDITIAGGTAVLQSGDDGVHADDALLIQNGNITVEKSYEGLEGNQVTITGGTITVTASDDGINSAGGSDTSMQGRPGRNSFSGDSNIFIRISGGIIKVDASGDGLDSNGNLYVDGGEVYVEGPINDGNGALDYEGTAEVTGGIVVAAGSAGMAMGFSDSSSQYSLLYNFSSTVTAGTTVLLRNSEGNEIISYTPQKDYRSVVITAPGITDGTYQIVAGDQSEEIAISSVVTSNGGNSGMPGRGGGHGMKQGEGRPLEDGMEPPNKEQPPEDGMEPPNKEQPPEDGINPSNRESSSDKSQVEDGNSSSESDNV